MSGTERGGGEVPGESQGRGRSVGGRGEGGGREDGQGQGGRSEGVREESGADSNYHVMVVRTFLETLLPGEKF